MKKYILLLILLMAFSFSKAQTILINGTVVSVSQDVTFPFWLDSMSTVEIGSQVISISALEFNIVPTTNGNSLVFSQTKIITSQETVPNGKTWKLEGVLLDSTATSTTTGSGNTTIVSGGEKAVALSEQSASTMNMGDAMLYCDSLQEDGYDNWVVPTLEEIMYVAGGGGVVAGTRTSDWLSTITPIQTSQYGGEDEYYKIRLSDGNILNSTGSAWIRCVRHESIAVSSSNGSSTPSTLGSGMPTMISNESNSSMGLDDAMIYCDTLNEGGYSDWILPTIDQLTYAVSGGCIINDSRTSNSIWSRSQNKLGSGYSDYMSQINLNTSAFVFSGIRSDNSTKCRCVR
jgi:hypothetical protein